MSPIAPVDRAERISSIDVLRGVALLGILLMNIQDFGLPGAAYWNPTHWGGATGADLGYWFANQIFFEGKMRTIFSMLFGAGFLVLTGRAEARGLEGQAVIADIYYRRTMWLMAFGTIHMFFVWWGDILFPYAFFGLFLFPLRKLSPKVLIGLGVFLLLLRMPFAAYDDYEQKQVREKGEAALAAEKAGKKLTRQQEEDKKKWEEKKKDLLPDKEKIQKDVNDHRLGYWANFKRRYEGINLGSMFTWVPTDVGGMMLIGMGLMKLGVFSGQLALGVYVRLMLFGYLLGAPVNAAVAWRAYQTNWDPLIWFPWWLFYDYGRLAVALGHIGLVMYICQKGWLRFLTSRLQAVGQTALSNYLLTSLLCTFFFNGYGFGFFGKLARHQLLYVLAAVWLINLTASPVWLRHYRFGPAEWLWRSLTYWQPQPMRLAPLALAALVLTGCAGRYRNFEPYVNEYAYQTLAFSPVTATAQGFTRFASDNLPELLDELGPQAIERQRQFNLRFKAGMEREVHLDRLHPLDRADYDLIQNQIALNLLEFEQLRSTSNSPTLYVETIGNALFSLYSLELDKEAKHRFFHIVRRMELIPRFLEQAKVNLKQAPEVHTRVAQAENDGNIALIDGTLRKACPDALKPAFEKAAGPALKALRGFNDFLEHELAKRPVPWQLGAEKYARKFALVLGNDRTPDQVLADAEAELKKVQAEMQKIAGQQSIRQALDRLAQGHGTVEDYFPSAERSLKAATDFVRAKGIVTLGDTSNLKVIPTPVFMRGIYGVGGFNAAPALRPELGAFYWLTPIPPDWPKDRVESKLREYNRYALELLTIHEAMPGHYVQFEWANRIQPRGRRLLRNLYGSGAYVEGWAVYITQVMLEEGYLDHSPELKLTFLKQQLRMIGNAILDIRFHAKGWSDQEAMDFMLNETFQEREEAVAKLQRAKLSSCQLPTYFVGWQQFVRLREKMKAQPWYSLKEFHERTLRLGALPVPIVERLLLQP